MNNLVERPKLGSRDEYSIVIRQKNKIKGYEINFTPANGGLCSSIILGFVKSKKEVRDIINKHKQGR